MARFLSITTIAEARAALDYFDAFHDSFVRHVHLRSPEQMADISGSVGAAATSPSRTQANRRLS
jgi:hypothetical protein